MRVSTLRIPLSKLHPGRDNPRRVKPTPEAQQQLVASIRAFDLVQPLIVRPMADEPGQYRIIAGNRRLKALCQIHGRSSDDPKVRCEVRDVDDATAEAIALAENVVREQMHPLDEAEAFSRLAAEEAQGVDAIASAFGVTERYVRQRMRLAGLAKVVKQAFRENSIDLPTAAAFASVPPDRQTVVWEELNGHPRHAEHVRNIIGHGWINAKYALFDVSTLPDGSVSRDLFSEHVLVERETFMAAQLQAMEADRATLLETGWSQVVAGLYEDVHDQPLAMDVPEREFDPDVTRVLEKLADRRQRWEAKLDQVTEEDDRALQTIQRKLESLEAEQQEVEQKAPAFHSDATKAVATVFLILYPDGQVRREYRLPRRRRSHQQPTSMNGRTNGDGKPDSSPNLLTSDDLSDRQLADVFMHQVLAVREALIKSPSVRRRILALILYEKVRGESLAVRHEPNAVTLHATSDKVFLSTAFERLKDKRASLDPFAQDYSIDEATAFQRLMELPDARVGQWIDLLVVESLTTHLRHGSDLIRRLSEVLQVALRRSWRPDAAWLAGYQKVQLCHLLASLHGRAHHPNVSDPRKKSELLDALVTLFADAASGKIEDRQTVKRVNAWLPLQLHAGDPKGDHPAAQPTDLALV
ncbi:MAG TPA: ParB/RepB/Spo0J family partition protein [Tepidisphaeraceae bacterium]|jgi:ParB family chromosome partitioning protein